MVGFRLRLTLQALIAPVLVLSVQWVVDERSLARYAAREKRLHHSVVLRQKKIELNVDTSFRPGRTWLDTAGDVIKANSGGMFTQGETTYWYGAADYSEGPQTNKVINVYSSSDLYQWTNHGAAFEMDCDSEDDEADESCFVDRPRVLYDEQAGKYIMWMTATPYAAVAVATNPMGPFEFLDKFLPNDEEAADVSAYMNPVDNKGYLIYSIRQNGHGVMKIAMMDAQMTQISEPCSVIESKRTQPAIFYSQGSGGDRFYVWASKKGQASLFTAPDSLCAPSSKWKEVGNPTHHRTSYATEASFIMPMQNGDKSFFVYMGDRSDPFVDPAEEAGRYVWLPFTVKPEGKLTDRINVEWKDQWSLEKVEGI